MKYKSSISILTFQICTLAFQLAYAGFSSRQAAPSEFGFYASGLAIQAIFTLIFSSGFAEDVIRNHDLNVYRIGGITSRALTTGVVAFLIVLALGHLLQALISIPFELVIMTSLISGLTPIQNLLLGCYSQQKMFALSGFISFCSAVAGFIVGAISLTFSPTSASLMASPLVATLLFVSIGAIKYKSSLFPLETPSWANVRPSKFAFRIFIYRVFWFLNSNLARWALILTGLQPILGHLNRSEVVSSVPIQQLQSSIVNPFYPRAAALSKNGTTENENAFLITKASGAVVILVWTLFTICALGIQNLVCILLGTNWALASSVAPFLFGIGAIQIPVVVLSTVVETHLLFKKAYLAETLLVFLQAAGIVFFFEKIADLNFIITLMGAAMALRFLCYLGILVQRKFVDGILISKYLVVALLVSASFWLLHALLTMMLTFINCPTNAVQLIASAILGSIWFASLSVTKVGRTVFRDFSWLIKDG